MLYLRITVMGEDVLVRALSRFGEGVRNFTPVWEQIHLDFVQIEEQQFATQGGRGGAQWPALSPSYAAWKEKHFPGMPILQLTRAMWSQFAVGTGMLIDIKPMSLRMAPTLTYPQWHQRGTGRMPARKVVQLIEDDKMRWMKLLHNYVYDKARGANLI